VNFQKNLLQTQRNMGFQTWQFLQSNVCKRATACPLPYIFFVKAGKFGVPHSQVFGTYSFEASNIYSIWGDKLIYGGVFLCIRKIQKRE